MRVVFSSVQTPAGSSVRSSKRSLAQSSIRFFLLLLGALVGVGQVDAESNPLPPSITSAPLSVEQVVDRLIRKDEERAQALRHSESTRVYRLSYRGFPGDRDAEMKVDATYDSPSSKGFKIISQSGSKLIMDRVFKRLLDSEKEAIEPDMHARMLLNRDNYYIALIGFESPSVNSSDKGPQYVLAVYPKEKSKFLYQGKVWVDATDFAVTRIDAEPAQNPSFWTKKNEIHHEYIKVENFWLPQRNESISYIRLGGRATLTIDYSNYQVIDSRRVSKTAKASPAVGSR
jgi:hypothetical protein